MSIDENGVRESHFVQAFVIRDVFGSHLRVARHVDENVGSAYGDEVWSQSADQALDHVRQDARHAEGQLEMAEDECELDGASGSVAKFGDDDPDIRNHDEEDDEQPGGDGRVEVGIANGLVVAEEAPLRRRYEVELEDGEQRAGDGGEHDAANDEPSAERAAARARHREKQRARYVSFFLLGLAKRSETSWRFGDYFLIIFI